MNVFGRRDIDDLAADYIRAREAWEQRRDRPAYALRLDGRMTREAFQSRYIFAAQRLAIALARLAPDAEWDDGQTTLYADAKGVLRTRPRGATACNA